MNIVIAVVAFALMMLILVLGIVYCALDPDNYANAAGMAGV